MQEPKSKKTRISVRVNEEDKIEAQKIYKSLGLDLSTAINMFIRQTVRTKSLPVQTSLIPDEVLKARDDAINGKNLQTFSSIKELERAINED